MLLLENSLFSVSTRRQACLLGSSTASLDRQQPPWTVTVMRSAHSVLGARTGRSLRPLAAPCTVTEMRGPRERSTASVSLPPPPVCSYGAPRANCVELVDPPLRGWLLLWSAERILRSAECPRSPSAHSALVHARAHERRHERRVAGHTGGAAALVPRHSG